MRNIRILQILNFIAFIIMVTVNYLANAIPINGQSTGEVSAQFETLFTPAGYTFVIWAFIYAGLAVFIIFQSRGIFHQHMNISKTVVSQLGLVFILNCLANAAWIYAWHYEQFLLTVVLMMVILLSLIGMNHRIYRLMSNIETPKKILWTVKIPFGLYLGWICVATIANMSVYLSSIEWNAFGWVEELWMIIMAVAAGLIGIYLLDRFKLISAAIAIGWGLVGLIMKNWKMDGIFISNIVLIVMVIFILIGVFFELTKPRLAKEDLE